jgi:hypothetical protein
MKRRFTLLTLALVVLLTTALTTNVVGAQERGAPWQCFTDRSTYQICILRGGDVQMIHINDIGQGVEVARFPRDLVRYAAATLEPQAVQMLGVISNVTPEVYAELYYVGQSPSRSQAADDAPDTGTVDVYLTAVLYWSSGVRIVATDFVYPHITPSTAVAYTLPYREGDAPVSAAAPAAAPASGGTAPIAPSSTLDLTIVAPGTEDTCLARSTYTVRIRTEPTTNAQIVDRLPYGTTVRADLRTLDDQWLRVNYLGQLGWVNARFLDLTSACAGLDAIRPVQ